MRNIHILHATCALDHNLITTLMAISDIIHSN